MSAGFLLQRSRDARNLHPAHGSLPAMPVGSIESTGVFSLRRSAVGAFLLGALAMGVVQSGSMLPAGNDSFYHVRMARMLPEQGFIRAFPWLHWTLMREDFVSHHHGFHVLLAPWVYAAERWGGDPLPGGKAASIAAMGATALLMHGILARMGVAAPLAWTALLCVLPWHFWLRLAYVRAPMIGLPLLLGAAWLTVARRPLALAALAFVFTHVYGGFVLLPLVPVALVAGHLIAHGRKGAPWRCLAAAALGGILGVVINPYFPSNIRFMLVQLFDTGLGAPPDAGGEWKPFDAWFLLKMAAPVGAIWAACLVIRLRSGKPMSGAELGFTLLNLGFFVLTIKARRFVEYWPAFALLDAAQLARPGLDAWRRSGRSTPSGIRRTALAGAAILFAAVASGTILKARSSAKPGHDIAALRDAMTFLAECSPRGSLVLTDDWDVFPACFFFNTHNRYAVGLDPVFTSSRYPALWERYRMITRGETPGTLPAQRAPRGERAVALTDIYDYFGASYVLVARDHPKLFRQLSRATDDFSLVWPPPSERRRQPSYAVFRVEKAIPEGRTTKT